MNQSPILSTSSHWSVEDISNSSERCCLETTFSYSDELPIVVIYEIPLKQKNTEDQTIFVHRRYPVNEPRSIQHMDALLTFDETIMEIEEQIKTYILERSLMRLQLLTQDISVEIVDF